jgi:hypothetical protein
VSVLPNQAWLVLVLLLSEETEVCEKGHGAGANKDYGF